MKNGNSSCANMSIQLNEFGGEAELILNKMSLQGYYDTFSENDIDNKLVMHNDMVLDIFDRLTDSGHAGVLLDMSTVWVFSLKGNYDTKDIIISKWIVLMKFPTQLPVNSVIYGNLLKYTTVELYEWLTCEEIGLLQLYVHKMIGEEDE